MSNGDDFAQRQAILVIHGIGRQRRFETLDRFANGLRGVLHPDRVVHVTRPQGNTFQHFIRLEGERKVDLYEYYWAPKTEAKTSFTAVLRWVLKTGLTPIRQLAFNLPLVMTKAIHDVRHRPHVGASSAQAAEKPMGVGKRALVAGGRTWRRFRALALWGFFRELGRVTLVTFLTLALVGSITWLVTQAGSLGESDIWRVVTDLPLSLGLYAYLRLVAMLVTLVLVFALLKSLGQQRRDLAIARQVPTADDPDRPDEIGARWLFLTISVLLVAALLVVFAGLAHSLLDPAADLLVAARYSPELLNLLLLVAAAAAAVWVRRLLKDYVADIALYTAADERSPFAEIREQILKEAAERIDWLLRRPYGSVAVAGHSLGSVIAYDAIARLAYDAEPWPGGEAAAGPARQRLEKLDFLITFGSPLNKVLYFFRTIVEDRETVRAKILARLYGFRRPRELLATGAGIGSGMELGDRVVELDGSEPPLNSLFWLNVYSPFDIVSAPLVFYEGVIDFKRYGGHMSYWTDAKFYQEVAAALEHRIATAEVPVRLEVASRHQAIYHLSSSCVYAQQIAEGNRVFGEAARRDRRPHHNCPAGRRFRSVPVAALDGAA